MVWCNDGFYGCALASPVSTATVSAARLRSQPVGTQDAEVELAAPTEDTRIDLPLQTVAPGALSLRQKTATIIGLAVASWGVVIGGVMLVI